MAGKRQPTAVVEANGRKHLSRAETDARRDAEIQIPPAEKVTPPKWLPKECRTEFRKVGEMLRDAGLYSDLDRDVLAQYFLCRVRWLAADTQAAAAIASEDEKLAKEWTSVQQSYFRQARQCAEAVGLSVSSRCRLVVPEVIRNAAKGTDEEDEFTKRLRDRQQSALEAVR